MLIEFSFARPPEYFRRYTAGAGRRAAVLWAVGAAGLALVGCAVVAFGDTGGGDAVFGGLVFAVAVGWALWQGWRRLTAKVAIPDFWGLPRDYCVDDDALHVSTELSAMTFRWPLVRHVLVDPDAYVFRVEHFGIVDLPRVPLTAEQDAELRTFLAARGLIVPAVVPEQGVSAAGQ